MLKPDVDIVQYDPFCYNHCQYQSELANRIKRFALDITHDQRADQYTRNIFARLCSGDLTLCILIAIYQDQLVGHSMGEITTNEYGDKELFVSQCEVDPGFPSLVDTFMQLGDNYGTMNGATVMRMESWAKSHTPEAWTRKYGFKLINYQMERPINGR